MMVGVFDGGAMCSARDGLDGRGVGASWISWVLGKSGMTSSVVLT